MTILFVDSFNKKNFILKLNQSNEKKPILGI